MPGAPQRDEAPVGPELPGLSTELSSPAPSATPSKPEEASGAAAVTSDEKRNASQGFEEAELEAALQLLVERAQYITGATGTALALPQSGEMVCRASAGSCAPSIGARLQVRSGLTGESIARRQLLRCDNAETDPRVNLETCRALGIASIVVLPMLRRNGEVRGLFELFSDHPYAFEERDLIALERMADLTLTALDLAEQRHGGIPPARAVKTSDASPPAKPAVPVVVGPILKSVLQATEAAKSGAAAAVAPAEAKAAETSLPESTISSTKTESPTLPLESSANELRSVQAPAETSLTADHAGEAETKSSASVPEAMRRLQKCASCGFPISEGRTICLDCEKKKGEPDERIQSGTQTKTDDSTGDGDASAEENIPAFLANAQPFKESWLSAHLNHLLAILVFILGVLVAIVVFR
jgi:putative methionine-R-sulfoxide reductase with GAF domain